MKPETPTTKRRFGRRKVCPFCADKTLYIDYKTPSMLKRFISERGKIVPRRISGVCAPHQRTLQNEIKRARVLAFMPYSSATAD
ncbi:MAG: 30S ribosomal protein S18 [Myxococcales bacterium]|nr:30S ribosomal protein S18 [Myxococcales bacterium]